jgi:hypothetical protein
VRRVTTLIRRHDECYDAFRMPLATLAAVMSAESFRTMTIACRGTGSRETSAPSETTGRSGAETVAGEALEFSEEGNLAQV